ncbi:MAG TPA: hypothetical protein VMH22_06970 [bacterium]|nr:hypothetical protein [bacterium]
MSIQKQLVRAGEPFLVTVAMHNTTDTVCIWGYVALSGFQLVGLRGDTWDYRPYDWVEGRWGVGGPPPFFGVRPHDSVYEHCALWPRRFFHRSDTTMSMLCAGSYRLIGGAWQFWVLKDSTWARMPFMPSESIPVSIVSDSGPGYLGAYQGLLDRWFYRSRTRADWKQKKAAGETLLTAMQSLPVDADSALLTVGYQLADLAEYGGHWTEAPAICESIIARHPPGTLAEDLGGYLPRMYELNQMRQTADSLVRVFVLRYPRNVAALSYEEGRWLWYERLPLPPVWVRWRSPFLGLPGPWSPWCEEAPSLW